MNRRAKPTAEELGATFGELKAWVDRQPEFGSIADFARALGKPEQTVYSWFRRPERQVPAEIKLLVLDQMTKFGGNESMADLLKKLDNKGEDLSKALQVIANVPVGVRKLFVVNTHGVRKPFLATSGEKDDEVDELVNEQFVLDDDAEKVFTRIFNRQRDGRRDALGEGEGLLICYESFVVWAEPLSTDANLMFLGVTDTEKFDPGALAKAGSQLKRFIKEEIGASEGLRLPFRSGPFTRVTV